MTIKKDHIREYLEEMIYFGGVPERRFDVIKYLEKLGAKRLVIEEYMQRLEKVVTT
jgi:hypothetical protein